MTTITLKNIKEVDSIIEGIFDNYSSNIPEVDICDASIDDLVENADAMGAGDLKEEIASVIVGKSDFKEMIDAAYLVAILRDHAELQGSWEIRSGLYLQTLENLQSEGFDFDYSATINLAGPYKIVDAAYFTP